MPKHFLRTTLIGVCACVTLAQAIDLTKLQGDWQLRVMDGYDVRKVRTIVEFMPQTMRIAGFDACNRIGGKLTPTADGNFTTTLTATHKACRGQSFIFVSKRFHETFAAPFSMKLETRYGIEGLTIKGASHDLFFKRMGKE